MPILRQGHISQSIAEVLKMSKAFLLRFQEECTPDDTNGLTAGTMTKTSTHSEQSDSDPRQNSYSALTAGTATSTRVAAEQGDKDQLTEPTTIPRQTLEVATKTATAVRAEISDDDPGRILHGILPRCSSF